MRLAPALSLLLLLASAVGATAQVNKTIWIVQAGYVGDAVVATGFRWSYTPAPVARIDPETGMTLPVVSRITWHAAGAGGISVGGGGDRSVDWTALGSLGLVRPIGVGPLSGVGLIGLGALQPNGAGPGIRLESGFRVLCLNAGVLFSGNSPRAAVTVDISGVFLRDLFR
jgi:hypothetical protein